MARFKKLSRNRRSTYFLGGIFVFFLLGLSSYLYLLFKDLPDVSELKRKNPPLKQGVRFFVPLASMPDSLIKAVVAAEDCNFFRHHGVDYKAMWDAARENFHKRRIVRGGSTITQQLAKNLYLEKERTLSRKIREFWIARQLEKHLTKNRILELYLNIVEWGPGIYGVEAASRRYFHKSVRDIDLGEAVLLVAMLPNPYRFNPERNPYLLARRARRILNNMRLGRYITAEEYQRAVTGSLVEVRK